MNKEEFKRKVSNLISVAQHWQMHDDDDNDDKYNSYRDLTKERELELLAEHDRLTAQLAERKKKVITNSELTAYDVMKIAYYGATVHGDILGITPEHVMETKRKVEQLYRIEFKVDEITAELERLRWHYPERGELPEEGEFIMISGYDKFDFMTINYSSNDKENYKKLVKRWRYIE